MVVDGMEWMDGGGGGSKNEPAYIIMAKLVLEY